MYMRKNTHTRDRVRSVFLSAETHVLFVYGNIPRNRALEKKMYKCWQLGMLMFLKRTNKNEPNFKAFEFFDGT